MAIRNRARPPGRAVGQRRAVRSGKKMSYAQLIARLVAAGAVAVWDAGAAVYSDTGTTPIAADGVVKQWNDQIGGYHVVAEDAPTDRRPIYRASVAALNNRPALQFDDTNDYLIRAVAGGVLNAQGNDYCGVIVFATDNNATLDYAYSEGGASATPSIRIGKNSDTVIGVHRDDASVTVSSSGGSGAGNGAMHVAGLRRLASNSWSMMLDGTQVGTSVAAPGTTTITHICIGALWQSSPTNAANQWGDYLAHVSLYPADVYAQVQPILDAWYRPSA